MKWSKEQTILIAVMFKIQFADKTWGEVFPGCICSEKLVGDSLIEESKFFGDILMVDKSITTDVVRLDRMFGYVCIYDLRGNPMITQSLIDFVKMINFEDKV